jgi:hypothetical protein
MRTEDLFRAIAEAEPSTLPALAVALGGRLAQLGAGMAECSSGRTTASQPPEAEDWITPEQAAAMAQVTKRRIYEWARGKRWAHRPSRRCLRISRAGFRTWLASRA